MPATARRQDRKVGALTGRTAALQPPPPGLARLQASKSQIVLSKDGHHIGPAEPFLQLRITYVSVTEVSIAAEALDSEGITLRPPFTAMRY